MIDGLSDKQYATIISLIDGSFFETDGHSIWLVDSDNGTNSYSIVSKDFFNSFLNRRIVVASRIDDEITRFYISEYAKEQFKKWWKK